MALRSIRLGMFLLALAAAACHAADPAFYVVDIRHNGDAMLHATEEKVDPSAKRIVTVLGGPGSTCCFLFGAQSKGQAKLKVDNDDPLLSSSRGDEAYQYLGAYKPETPDQPADRLAFGFKDMRAARLVGKRTYEVTFADAAKPVIVRHCLGTEGVNFLLYHSAKDAKPYVSYYFALGYDVTPDCPGKP